MDELYDGRLLVLVSRSVEMEDGLIIALNKAPDAYHAVLIDPFMPAGQAILIESTIEPNRLHELIFGPKAVTE